MLCFGLSLMCFPFECSSVFVFCLYTDTTSVCLDSDYDICPFTIVDMRNIDAVEFPSLKKKEETQPSLVSI